MTPGARIAAAIELLDEIVASPGPADRTAAGFLRTRRYIGSKDRRAITGMVFAVLRRQARLDWWLARQGREAAPRARILADLAIAQRQDSQSLDGCFTGPYAPAPLVASERTLIDSLCGVGLDHEDQPGWVRCEVPEWLFERFVATFGDGATAELRALLEEAPLDLRVNGARTTRAEAKVLLAKEEIVAEETRYSPVGLRVAGRCPVQQTAAFRNGLLEIQDEGSQIAALLVGARPGLVVADVCAGAGGKTLALAADMRGEGRLLALDAEARRLARARPRLQRAGVTGVEFRHGEGALAALAESEAESFGRVLVDAPCSGSGGWRRHPDARWRLTPEALARYSALQQDLLATAARLVRPGGRLVYVTCSLLWEENQAQAAAFAQAHPAFRLLPVPEVWQETFGNGCPSESDTLLLTPARHGTDGFFVAVFTREDRP